MLTLLSRVKGCTIMRNSIFNKERLEYEKSTG